ncbi:MAG TPA: peptidase M22 [Opitutaceae bacterium]|nr:peptidase M22 [Opitutaceae bacterium]
MRQLLAKHSPLLFIDAASARVQVGWVTEKSSRWETSEEESGIGVFRGVEALGVDPAGIGAFVFCEGPGSILGIRTVAMALRTWTLLQPKPVFSYQSLALVAHGTGETGLRVIADARRDSWHVFQAGGKLQRIATADLPGNLAMPEPFRAWTPVPANTRRIPYSLADLLPRVAEVDLFAPATAPDAFLHEEPNYVTWTPQVHRAPLPAQ